MGIKKNYQGRVLNMPHAVYRMLRFTSNFAKTMAHLAEGINRNHYM